MSQYLFYIKDGKYYLAYRGIYVHSIGVSSINAQFQNTISKEQNERREREDSERRRLADIIIDQTRSREGRARNIESNQKRVVEKIRQEQETTKEEAVKKLKADSWNSANSLEGQRKKREQERMAREQDELQERKRVKDLEEKLERQRAEQRALERKRKEEEFSGEEEELLQSIASTEQAISKLRARIEEKSAIAERNDAETLRILETLKRTQQDILRKEEENLEWKKRYESTELLRKESEIAYQREKKEREMEEAQMQIAQLESELSIINGAMAEKWRGKELAELKKKIAGIKIDLKAGSNNAVNLSSLELRNELKDIEQLILTDEKTECQREYVATRFLDTIRHLGYSKTTMFQQDPKDPRSTVIVKGEFESGKAVEIAIPFGDVYSIKFSGISEQRSCCSEESAIREIMEKLGVSSKILEPAVNFNNNLGKPGVKLQFKDGDKKIDLTQQFCG